MKLHKIVSAAIIAAFFFSIVITSLTAQTTDKADSILKPGVINTYRLSPEYKARSFTKTYQKESNSDSNQPITAQTDNDIETTLYTIKIISPKEDEKVDLYFDLVGQARPNSTIDIVPLSGIGGTGTIPSSSDTTGAITIKADENGFFKLNYGFPFKIPFFKMQYKLRVSAVDEQGNKSLPKIVVVQVKDEPSKAK